MNELKTKTSITVDDSILEEVKRRSEQDDRSVSSYINLVLREHLAHIKNK